MAPEVKNKGPKDGDSAKVDCWAVGVMAYQMLCGKLVEMDNEGKPIFDSNEWIEISPLAKSFISSLLELNPLNRLSAQEASQHEWMLNVPQKC